MQIFWANIKRILNGQGRIGIPVAIHKRLSRQSAERESRGHTIMKQDWGMDIVLSISTPHVGSKGIASES